MVISTAAASGRRAAPYARVSTLEQSPENQLHAIRPYSAARGWVIAEEFVDHGVSGAKDRRRALDRLLKAARARQVDVIVVTKLDRLARSTHHLVTIAQELAALGVDLVVVDQQIDTTTPSGRLLFHVLAAIAEFERDLIRDRVKAGLDRARAKGVRLGRPSARVAEDELASLWRAQLPLAEIARRMGASRSTIRRRLSVLGATT
jgi:DNA invertase Pin-like site-specific DNA recombinase